MEKRMIYVLTRTNKITRDAMVLCAGYCSVQLRKAGDKEHGESLMWQYSGSNNKVVYWAKSGNIYTYEITKTPMLVGGTLIKRGERNG